ncbi:hypothetical protein Jab_1c25350 [Janthinobacterium sp. HH01]|uniref:hypothetical protein n=1 Tax=Janthinobacterium sp. HH01 TaxID=1198452 RepID=UPI0002AE8EF4|nr:hypothetical protein [Janthinobacterium sp. HH01]ELX13895.1 hypothetical protein Jab_1c25350 [Janthinobacterium sp. HH01]
MPTHSLQFPIRVPDDVLLELGEFTGLFWSDVFGLEPFVCEAIRNYINPPPPPPQQPAALSEAGYQWKLVCSRARPRKITSALLRRSNRQKTRSRSHPGHAKPLRRWTSVNAPALLGSPQHTHQDRANPTSAHPARQQRSPAVAHSPRTALDKVPAAASAARPNTSPKIREESFNFLEIRTRRAPGTGKQMHFDLAASQTIYARHCRRNIDGSSKETSIKQE